jgi:hypothetical protein
MKQDQVALTEFTAKIQMEEALYQSNFELNIKMAGLKTPDTYCVESQRGGRLLSDMVKDKPLLIYKFSGNNCNTCYIDILTKLQSELPDNFGFDKIRALCSQLTERDLLILKRTYKIKFPIYIIPSKSFDWIVEENNVPYFFVLCPDMKILHIYVPNKDYPELTQKYIEDVKKFLLE